MDRDGNRKREELVAELHALRADLEKACSQAPFEALERSETSLRNAQRIAQLGSWDANLETGVLYWSDEHYRIYGVEPGTPVDYQFFLACVHHEDRERVHETVQTALRTGNPFQLEYRIVRKEGDVRHLSGQGEVELDAKRRPIRIRGTGQDVSERRQLEGALADYRDHLEELVEERTRELKASQQKLAEADRMASLGTLATGIAHQINNPIAVILLAAEYGKLSAQDPDYRNIFKQVIDDIATEAQRCAETIRGVLQFASSEPTTRWPDDLNATVQRACIVTGQYAGERNASLEFELPRERITVAMNPIEIEQVLVNLIRNAVESKASGARIRIRTCRVGSRARIEISDDGRGLDEDQQKRIFDPFYTTRLNDGGAGLGLSVAHGMVSGHAGTLSVESTLGRGTTLTVDLPCHDGATPGA